MDSWEYKVTTLPPDQAGRQSALNGLGSEGWELTGERADGSATFKRRKAGAQTADPLNAMPGQPRRENVLPQQPREPFGKGRK